MVLRANHAWIAWVALGLLIGIPDAPQISFADGPYEANWESLDQRQIPSWFQDAKFGIFIHWGVYSVPAWAPKGQYAEWYWNRLGGLGSGLYFEGREGSTWEYHLNMYGKDVTYIDFARQFKAQMFDPDQWARLFRKSGARYVVLTSKHHDGFCLFPSKEANRSWGRPWNSVDTGPFRDLLGDLGNAVRNHGLRMGFYYSLYEWYNPLWVTDREVFVERHMLPQFKDVVTRYRPSIIFADGEWDMPSSDWKSTEFLAWLFNETDLKDEVVVNDRWGKETRHHHGDYYTTEYTAGLSDIDHPWEESRGMGHSYGYNRNEPLEEYRTGRELILMFVDLVSRGGNLLLNVGPTGDGRIPVIMEQRLTEIGDWLQINGDAIYETRPWKENRQWSEGEIPKVEYGGQFMVKYDINEVTGKQKEGKAVIEAFFTSKEDTVYAILPRWPGDSFRLKNINIAVDSSITLLGYNRPLSWQRDGEDIVVQLPVEALIEFRTQPAFSLKVTKVK